MKAIFFADKNNKIDTVFTMEQKKEISRYNNGDYIVYTKSDFGKVDFSKVEYIFSTWYMPELTVNEIKKFFPALKAVFYAAGTVKKFAKSFIQLGIDVYNADIINAIPVAEFAYAQIILSNKGYFQSQLLYRKYKYNIAKRISAEYPGNYLPTVGIIGFGRIGRKVAELLSNNDINVIVNDINILPEECIKLGIENVSLEELFSRSDVISNHLPDISSTLNILNYDLFKKMKKNATFINTGRGRQVEEKGLAKALREEKGRSAILDVLRHEPLLPISPLFFRKNVFVTPHIAGSIGNEENRMAEYVITVYKEYVNGKISDDKVTLDMIEHMT